jgi:murein DD-endopeptidase MepM/ murein hydrolase activator NlpD
LTPESYLWYGTFGFFWVWGARGKVGERFTFSVRFGDTGRSRQFRIGRTGMAVITGMLALFFALGTQFIYDYRENLAKVRELASLRHRVSEQDLTLYNLYAKFESLETEVERIRALDARVRSLVNINEALLPGKRKTAARMGIGGAETPETSAKNRLDSPLDLRFDQLKESLLVDGKNLEILCERLDARRTYLESLPSLWPVHGLLASGFGVRVSPFTDTEVFHHGLDIDAPKGSPIRAAGAGKVVRCGFEPRYGNLVVIDHGNGYRTIYAHLSKRMVELGDTVRRGDLIGKVGDSGRTTGPHLHYEVHVNGLPVNPVRFLN